MGAVKNYFVGISLLLISILAQSTLLNMTSNVLPLCRLRKFIERVMGGMKISTKVGDLLGQPSARGVSIFLNLPFGSAQSVALTADIAHIKLASDISASKAESIDFDKSVKIALSDQFGAGGDRYFNHLIFSYRRGVPYVLRNTIYSGTVKQFLSLSPNFRNEPLSGWQTKPSFSLR